MTIILTSYTLMRVSDEKAFSSFIMLIHNWVFTSWDSFHHYSDILYSDESVGLKSLNNFPMFLWHALQKAIFSAEHGFASSMNTITRPNTQSSSTTTAKKWPWELAVSFVRCMGEICLHGNNSKIQRDAMIGCQGNISAGLLQFLKFQLQVESKYE